MPHKSIDYSKTIIYKIQHRDKPHLVYVGHTTNYVKRKNEHKRYSNDMDNKTVKGQQKVYTTIRENGGWEEFNMIQVKEFPCDNSREACAEEDKIMQDIKAGMNTYRAFATDEYAKARDNKAKKIYRERNREEISIKVKKWNDENRDHKLAYMVEYAKKNKERIAEYDKMRKSEKVECDCGCVVCKGALINHKKTKKHADIMATQAEKIIEYLNSFR